MAKSKVLGRLKLGSFEEIRHLFPDGVPLESMMPTGVSEDGRFLIAVDRSRLTPEQFVTLCGENLDEFEIWVISNRGMALFAEDFCQLTELS